VWYRTIPHLDSKQTLVWWSRLCIQWNRHRPGHLRLHHARHPNLHSASNGPAVWSCATLSIYTLHPHLCLSFPWTGPAFIRRTWLGGSYRHKVLGVGGTLYSADDEDHVPDHWLHLLHLTYQQLCPAQESRCH
jgi:hypothetical protein